MKTVKLLMKGSLDLSKQQEQQRRLCFSNEGKEDRPDFLIKELAKFFNE